MAESDLPSVPSLEIRELPERLVVVMRPGGNRWLIGLGLAAALPWLAGSLGGSVAIVLLVPGRTTVLAVAALNLLFGLVHIVAVAGVWLALYNLRGSETLVIDASEMRVTRRGAGLSVPLKLLRRGAEEVVLLERGSAPGTVHPRLEARSGRSAIRFGAGLTTEEARAVRDVAATALQRRDDRPSG